MGIIKKLITVLSIVFLNTNVFTQTNSNIGNAADYDFAFQLKFRNPDSAIVLFNNYHNTNINKGDTLEALKALINVAELYGHNNYSKSYNLYWEALLLADQINNNVIKADIYIGIGILYDIYNRKNEALKYYKLALELNKSSIKEGTLSNHEIIHKYYALVIYHRKMGNLSIAKQYIDSCIMVAEPDNPKHFINSEKAFIAYLEGNLKQAEDSLLKIAKHFEEFRSSYLVIVYSFMGDLYRDKNEFTKSKQAYLKSIEYGERYHSHQDYKIDVINKLADLLFEYGDFKNAFSYLKKSYELNQEFFGSRSSGNKQLLEIQDNFRLVKEAQDDLLREQRISALEHEERVWFLKNIILLGSIAFILIFGYLFVRNLRLKHKASKQQISLEMRKAHEILEIKNRELAASTLQIIEKEKILQEVKNTLKSEKDSLKPHDLDKIAKSIHISSEGGWEEFEARFIAVNESFYDSLRAKFPKLTQGDHRLSALIKLNFSSKEMSNLLGISVESVHSSRYKLRKKLGLTREQNLTEFIANL